MAREPKSSQRTRAVRAKSCSRCRRWTKRRAARIGPTVWELEGPMPMVKRSKTLSAMLSGYHREGGDEVAMNRRRLVRRDLLGAIPRAQRVDAERAVLA